MIAGNSAGNRSSRPKLASGDPEMIACYLTFADSGEPFLGLPAVPTIAAI
jgi:hypothetical protein